MAPYTIASVSYGKDSLAMLHLSLTTVNEVVFYDTGMEFDAIYRERDRMMPILQELGIRYTELRPARPFLYDMLAKPVHKKDGTIQQGYGWCGGTCRWGTSAKNNAIDKLVRQREKEWLYVEIDVGIAADEVSRLKGKKDSRKRYPLVELGMTEADCLALCYERGHTWDEDGVQLYDVLDRVSCWCCRNKNLKELQGMAGNLPKYYGMLQGLEKAISEPMKRGKVLADGGPRTREETQ